MTNTLFLPELREMLSESDAASLAEFCKTLHPARTAEFMEGLTAAEAWSVLKHTDESTRVEIYHYFDFAKQVEMIESLDRAEMAVLIGALAPDERVDILKDVEPAIVDELLPLLPAVERRDIQRLTAYEEGTAGSVMTTSFARLSEKRTARQAIDDLATQAANLETIYYLYVVDEEDHLRGVVSARQLVSAMAKPDVPVADMMERSVVSVQVTDDQEDVADVVAKYDLLAVPVVDQERRLVGIITHDDVIDVMREEAIEDIHMQAGISPLEDSYLATSLVTLAWKRGMWLTLLFVAGLLTALALQSYDEARTTWPWLAIFIPLIVSTGGNSGSQSATLVITALTAGHVTGRDWARVAVREVLSGMMLGGLLSLIGYGVATILLHQEASQGINVPSPFVAAIVVPVTIVLVVIFGTLCGAMLPLLFHRLGLDPALMSTPCVAGIIDIVGIVLYMNVAVHLLAIIAG
ncbi:MAG: magnesium transporter [Pirellulales bacterium]